MKYYRPIIAEPCEQARKAGAKTLVFKYVDLAADYFHCDRNFIYQKIRGRGRGFNLSYCGFYFKFGD